MTSNIANTVKTKRIVVKTARKLIMGRKTSILKILLLPAVLLSITMLTINTGCIDGRPPDHNVINPAVISDGSMGYILAYQNNQGKGPITYLKRIGADGNYLWETGIDSSQPYKPYSNSPTELVSDGTGNIFVIWGLGDDIWIKKYDINGNSVWNNKVKIGSCSRLYKLKAFGDNHGGVITGCYGQDGDFWFQVVNSEGKSMWSPEKRMSNIAGFDILTDSSGAILLFYVNFERSFYLQKVDLSATNLWDSPVLLSTHRPEASTPASKSTTVFSRRAAAGEYETWLISDKHEGYITGYGDTYGDTYEDRSLNVFKVNADGTILWTKRLIATVEDKNSQITDFATSKVVDDGMGGILIISRLMRIPDTKDTSLIVRRIDSSGNETSITDNGLVAAENAWNVNQSSRYEAIPDGSGGVIVIWVSTTRNENNVRTGAILRGQKLDRDSRKIWGEAGVILSTTDIEGMNGLPSLISDGSSGFIVSLGASGSGLGSIIWRIGPDGNLVWEKRL
jgi:hypothetical protein